MSGNHQCEPIELDLQGLLCPLPVLKIRKFLRENADVSEVIALITDPAAQIDVPHFCNENGHKMLSVEELDQESDQKLWRYRIGR